MSSQNTDSHWFFWNNDRFIPFAQQPTPTEAFPSPSNPFPAALLYGYSVFTTFCFCAQRPLQAHWLNEHLLRLAQNARQLDMTLPTDLETLQHDLLQGLYPTLCKPSQANASTAWRVRLTLFPQVSQWSQLIKAPSLPGSLWLLASPLAPFAKPTIHWPAHLALFTACYSKPLPTLKHGSLCEALLLERQRYQNQQKTTGLPPADTSHPGQLQQETVWLQPDGMVTETTTGNIFAYINGAWQTPLRSVSLAGVAQTAIMACGQQQLPTPIQHQAFCLQQLQQAEGVFVSNSVQLIRPVGQINHQAIPWSSIARKQTQMLAEHLWQAFYSP
ncbi:MAG: aminotransferase class IV [Candidatus Melainabacteria bacterium]|nr:aminotransferase class IV [Candidatus Melainabacteria bacterium]